MILRAMCKVCEKQRLRAKMGHRMATGSAHNNKVYDDSAECMRAVYERRKRDPKRYKSHLTKKSDWNKRKRRGLVGTPLPVTPEFAELWRRERLMRPGCTNDPSLIGLNTHQYEHIDGTVRRSSSGRKYVWSAAVDAFMTYVDKQYLLGVLWGPEDWKRGRPKA